jgi:hypothetical protein
MYFAPLLPNSHRIGDNMTRASDAMHPREPMPPKTSYKNLPIGRRSAFERKRAPDAGLALVFSRRWKAVFGDAMHLGGEMFVRTQAR